MTFKNRFTDRYILDGKTPVPCKDVLEWSRWFDNIENRVVVKDEISTEPDVRVSTVFLGIDHSFSSDPSGPPILFETLVFGGPLDGEMDRYATWDEAEKGHALMLAKVRVRQ